MSLNISSDTSSSFIWDDYLLKTNGRPAKRECFKQSLLPPSNYFEPNTLLEAEDQRSAALDTANPVTYSTNTPRTRNSNSSTDNSFGVSTPSVRRTITNGCPSSNNVRRFRAAAFSLARVVETLGPRLRVRLVGTDDRNDYWFLVDSDQIRPYPSGNPLQPPFGYMHNHLVWNRTLKKATEGAKYAQSLWFIKPPPDPEDNLFQVNDKLEAVDRRNTQLICPASIGAINSHHVLISFDGWSGAFDYWTRFDSRELFPVGWCKSADYPLQSPGPNAIRSPTSHSTPSILRLPIGNVVHSISSSVKAVGQQQKQKRSANSKLRHQSVDDIKSENAHKSLSNRLVRKKTFTQKKIKPYSKKLKLLKSAKRMSTVTPYPPKLTTDRSLMRNSYPPTLSRPDLWSGYPGQTDSDRISASNFNESYDSSVRSSPPLIHPISDDLNEHIANPTLSPPHIEAVQETPRHRRASSSECVVRLQAKSAFSSNESVTQPELKSWQVVTEPRNRTAKKTKSDKSYNSVDKDGLKKKLKLVNGNTTQHSSSNSTCDQNQPPSDSNTTSSNNRHVVKPMDVADTDQTLAKHLNRGDETAGSALLKYNDSYLSLLDRVPLSTNCHHYHNNNNNNQQPSKDRLSIETIDHHSNSMYWLDNGLTKTDLIAIGNGRNSGKLAFDLNGCHSTGVANGVNLTDYLDSQSLATTQLPSSTVSPSSLDLGPCPLPNPSQWTIEEVYHYITTRDTALTEAAEIFKHHEIDGQALLLLNMESLRNYMKIKLGPALKIDHLIGRLKHGSL